MKNNKTREIQNTIYVRLSDAMSNIYRLSCNWINENSWGSFLYTVFFLYLYFSSFIFLFVVVAGVVGIIGFRFVCIVPSTFCCVWALLVFFSLVRFVFHSFDFTLARDFSFRSISFVFYCAREFHLCSILPCPMQYFAFIFRIVWSVLAADPLDCHLGNVMFRVWVYCACFSFFLSFCCCF